MAETALLEFTGLGLRFELNRVAFLIAGRPIYWYGVLFGAAFVAAALYILKRTPEFGLDSDRVIDVLLGTVLGGLAGARLYYVAFSWDTYKDDLMKILNVREGGIAIYGGIIGAVLAAAVMCRLRRVRFVPLSDLFLNSLLAAQAIGRWGNFVNIEAFGGNTGLPWGMSSPVIQKYLAWNREALAAAGMNVDPALPVHPTFFYESMWCLAGFALLALYARRRRYDGELSLMYLCWYGAGRFFIEGLRTDSLMLGSYRVSQVLAGLCVVASAALLVFFRRKLKAGGDPDFMRLYVNTEEGRAVLSGAFYKKKDAPSECEAVGDEAVGDEPREDSLPEGDGSAAEPEVQSGAQEERLGDS